MENIIYKTAKSCLGKDMAISENEYGCAEAVNEVVRLAIGQEVGGKLSTTKMYQSLLTDKRFKQVMKPDLGDIIISPTGYGQGIGHTGIISDNGRVMSNNSKTYLWDEHLTLAEWWYKYKNLPTAFFRYQFPKEKAIIVSDIERQKISILTQMIAVYKQIILLLSVKKLGSKYMKSKLFRINSGDLGRGLFVAVLSTVFLAFGTALNAENFSFASFDYASLIQVAMASGMGYIVKNFISNSEGTILGAEK